jgi:hypothetical protein
MQQPIVIQGRVLSQSSPSHSTLTYAVTPTDSPAARTKGKGGASVLVNEIKLDCKCSGAYTATPATTFTGTGTASIVASTPRVLCEGQQMLTEGDQVVINCTGTVTDTTTLATSPGTASVTVTITDGVQKNVNANKV